MAKLLSIIQRVGVYRKMAKLVCPRILIKEATGNEMSAVFRLQNPESKQQPGEKMTNPNTTNIIAVLGEKIIGHAQLVRRGTDDPVFQGHWLYGLYVKTPFRGLGIGEALCMDVLARAKHEGAVEISLLVRRGDERAGGLYRKLGFDMKTEPEMEQALDIEEKSLGFRRALMRKQLDGE